MSSIQDPPEFKIDEWGQTYGTEASLKLHGSYTSAFTLTDLLNLDPTGSKAITDVVPVDTPLDYGDMRGSERLRSLIAEMHSSAETKLTADNVITTPAGIMANYLVLATLCGPGDHAICQHPIFPQLSGLPALHGADVSLWRSKADDGWRPDFEQLEALIKPNTRVIIMNNPNNPAGSFLSKEDLEKLIAICEKHKIHLMSDEIFAPLFHDSSVPPPPPLVSLGFTQAICTGSLSKAYALPGVRIGWIVSLDTAFLTRIKRLRDYTTSSLSRIDDSIACYVLSPTVRAAVIERSLVICKKSLDIIDAWIARNQGRLTWTRPQGAGTAFVRVRGRDGKPVDDYAFAKRLVAEKGVSVVPGGYAFGTEGEEELKGYLRIALGEKEEDLRLGLEKIQELIDES